MSATDAAARLERLHEQVAALEADLTSLLAAAVTTEGAHHKQWFLEQIADRLGITLPEHDEGIAP